MKRLGQVLLAGWIVLVLAGPAWDSRAHAQQQPDTEPPPGAPAEAPLLVVNLNSADEAELMRLPGIGPARARAILDFRRRHGSFRSVSQLLRIRGIGRATLRRLRPMLVLSKPAPHEPPSSTTLAR